jgi:uncharacterized protein YndB with AHSA1/START domain
MIKKVLLGLVVIIALILLYAAFQPSKFRIERSRSIAASPDLLFAQVNNHRNFAEWNPWEKMDPSSKTDYTGPDAGVGAVASWAGDKVGEGSATITESKPGELVRQRMDWKKPMEGASTVEFTFVPDGDKTTVTWAMFGENNYAGKLMSVFMDCEDMCGSAFEEGLADLEKVVTETPKTGE